MSRRFIADTLDITVQRVGILFSAETIPPMRHQQLLALGIPAELLPPPLFRKTGPKPKGISPAA